MFIQLFTSKSLLVIKPQYLGSKCHIMSELRSTNARKYQQKNDSCRVMALYIHVYGSIGALQRKKSSRSLFLSFHSSYFYFCHSFPVKLQLTFSPSSSFQSPFLSTLLFIPLSLFQQPIISQSKTISTLPDITLSINDVVE